MATRQKVIALKTFLHRGATIRAGEAEVPSGDVGKLVERGLISAEGVEPTAESESNPETQGVIDLLLSKQREGETSPLQTLQRIIDECEASRADLEALQARTQGEQPEDEQEPTFEQALELVVGKKAATSILEAGFDTPDKLAQATEKQLTDLPDVGEQTVKKIRENLKREG